MSTCERERGACRTQKQEGCGEPHLILDLMQPVHHQHPPYGVAGADELPGAQLRRGTQALL